MHVEYETLRRRWRSFLRWWREGMLAWLPRPLEQRLRGQAPALVLYVEDGAAEAHWVERGKARTLGTYAPNGGWTEDADPTQHLTRRMRAKLKGREAEVVVSLPEGQVLSKALSLPSQAAHDIQGVLRYQVTRLTPFQQDEVYYDGEVVGEDSNPGVTNLMAAFVPRNVADRWLDYLRDTWGYNPTRLTVAGWADLNLLPRGARAHRLRRGIWLNWVLAAVAVALALSVFYAPVVAKQQLVAELQQQVDKLKPSADKALELREKVEQRTEALQFVVEQKERAPDPLRVLEILSRLLPDHTWVHRLDLSGATLQVRGDSKNAAVLIELFEKSRYFDEPRFTAPVTRSRRSDRDRFSLEVQLNRAQFAS